MTTRRDVKRRIERIDGPKIKPLSLATLSTVDKLEEVEPGIQRIVSMSSEGPRLHEGDLVYDPFAH